MVLGLFNLEKASGREELPASTSREVIKKM